MENLDNIIKYRAEIQALESQSKELLNEVGEGFKRKYGFPMPSTSLQSLGIGDIYEIYRNKIDQFETNIKNEYIKLFSSIANSIAKGNIKPPLLDYKIPFKFIENSKHRAIYPTEQGKLLFYFLTKPTTNFRDFQSEILTEPGFFNQADVIIEKGKAPYKATIKYTKDSLHYHNILDKKGNITALGKGIREMFLKEIDDHGDYIMFKDVTFTVETFQSLIADFMHSNDLENTLIRIDGKENLEVNYKLLIDTSEKLGLKRIMIYIENQLKTNK
jgi:hypothetical protein